MSEPTCPLCGGPRAPQWDLCSRCRKIIDDSKGKKDKTTPGETEQFAAATADVLADATAALANEAMRHIAKICGERTGLMLSIANLVTHRFEMVYRIEFAKRLEQKEKKDKPEPEMKFESSLVEQ